mmetsp:Transcript_6310/g.21146  ORF Transcript_6310/g.21146 Transcript_6310/m.21146 type:complete len:214 (-) Transcript_6310:1009-1650(-)
MVAVTHRRRTQASHVRTHPRLRNAESHELLPRDDRSRHLLLHLRGSSRDDGRQRDPVRDEARSHETAASQTRNLVKEDEVVEGVEATLGRRPPVLLGPHRRVHARLVRLLVQVRRIRAFLLPVVNVGTNFLVTKRTDFGPKLVVRLLVQTRVAHGLDEARQRVFRAAARGGEGSSLGSHGHSLLNHGRCTLEGTGWRWGGRRRFRSDARRCVC